MKHSMPSRWAAVLLLAGSTAASASVDWAMKANAVVAADGSGQFKTVQEAINAAPQLSGPGSRWMIYIKAGIYKELVYTQREKRFISLVGEDATKTVITYGLYANVPGPDGKPIGTFRTPTALIDADDFTVENLTFENSAGLQGQALAIRVDGDRVVFRHCRILGWQDTILVNRGASISRTAISRVTWTSSSARRPPFLRNATSIACGTVISRPPQRPTASPTVLSSQTAGSPANRPR